MQDETNAREITQIIRAIGRGERQAEEHLAGCLYEDLKRTAERMMRVEPDRTLQPTALVHEAYLRLFGQEEIANCPNRAYFFGAAGRAMRRILVESARRRKSVKRGGQFNRQPMSSAFGCDDGQNLDLLALDEALTDLEQLNARQAEVVHLRWFANQTVAEVAEMLGVSRSTVEQDWRLARAFLKRQLTLAPEKDH